MKQNKKEYVIRPWWMEWPVEKQNYREAPKGIGKYEKIGSAMRKVNALKESLRPQKKADRGIAIIRGAIK